MVSAKLVVCAVVVLACAAASAVAALPAAGQQAPFASEADHAAFLEKFRAEHKIRLGSRRASHLARHHVSALFRRLDANHDKLLSKEDVQATAHKLAHHGITADHLSDLVSRADQDGDGQLNLDEMFAAFEDQLAPELLEVVAQASQAPKPGAKPDPKVAAGIAGVDGSNDACVICQYIVERCETAVRAAGAVPTRSPFGYQNPDGIFVEADAAAQSSDPFDLSGKKEMSSTRLSTRFQRTFERQKYNEIYRTVDIVLDDVCEQGMPNSFYGFCKQVYQVQADVVDGLRYQYNPPDICFRIGMCGKSSYITQGIHSRFKNMDAKADAKGDAKEKAGGK